jgi:hypothetical protein
LSSNNNKHKTDQEQSGQEGHGLVLTGRQQWKGIMIGFWGWLIPGAGYWIVGRKTKALLVFVMLTLLFIWGMMLHGEIVLPILDTKSTEFNLVNILVFILGIGNGIMTLLNLLPSIGQGQIIASTYEVGTLFMVVSGAMNVFFAYHAWDLFREDIIKGVQTSKS